MNELVDISAVAGLTLHLDESNGLLRLGPDVTSDAATTRTRDDLAPVLRQPHSSGPELAYHLYRDVRRITDESVLSEDEGLRYDLTVTLPGAYGDEYVKTAGHYHPPDLSDISFPEIYEVLHGRAAFVLQHVDDVTSSEPIIEDVWVQVCDTGDRIVIPPGCGHVTVNIGSVPLVVSDLISRECGHLYASFAALRGAAYHVLVDPNDDQRFTIARNAAYRHVPEPVVAHGSRWEPVVVGRSPLYEQAIRRPQDFEFLRRPARATTSLFAPWLVPATRST